MAMEEEERATTAAGNVNFVAVIAGDGGGEAEEAVGEDNQYIRCSSCTSLFSY